MALTQSERSFKYNHSEKGIKNRTEYRDGNRMLLREKGRKYMKEHYEKHKKYMREEYYPKNLEIQRNRSAEFRKTDRYEESRRQRKIVVRNEVFSHYSPDGIKCALCNVTNIDVLSIDHIHGDGSKHRKELKGKSGHGFYLWLIQHGFPVGYRVLCLNCQRLEAIRLKLFIGNRTNHHYKKYPTVVCSVDRCLTGIRPVVPVA